jgi:hypothetical protein
MRSAASIAAWARRDRKLDALVGADRPPEDDPLRRVPRGLFDEPAAVTDALRGDQHALGIHPVEDVAEPTPLLADQRVLGQLDAVEKTSVVAWFIIV